MAVEGVKTAIGLMSGTSMDGIDAAVRLSQSPPPGLTAPKPARLHQDLYQQGFARPLGGDRRPGRRFRE